MNAGRISGMAVISIASGARLGRVEDLAFDPQQLRVAALRVSADGQHALIPFAHVHTIGSDAVTVPSDDVTQWGTPEGSLTTLPGLGDLRKLKVVDEAGTLLGTVRDVEIDPQDGRITQVATHAGGVLGIGGTTRTIAVQEIRSVGADVMMVAVSGTPS
jgi:sporulation protein YlmC with PRC-barrel domain